MGEILRLVICKLIDESVLFLGQNMYKIESPYVLDTAFFSLMESDLTEELLMIISIFTHFFALEMTLAGHRFFCALAKLVGHHMARLNLCGIAAIMALTKMGYLDVGCSVGADGSLYNVCSVTSVSPWVDCCLHGGRESRADSYIHRLVRLTQKYPGFLERVLQFVPWTCHPPGIACATRPPPTGPLPPPPLRQSLLYHAQRHSSNACASSNCQQD
jgi:hypothetical protein